MKLNESFVKTNKTRFQALALAFVLIMTGAALIGAKKTKMKPEHQEFRNYCRYLFTKAESRIFKRLTTDKARGEFIQNFWEIRDPNPYTEENEFKIKMEERFEYVRKYLKEGPIPGYKTDRGRIYILLGEPSSKYERNYSFGAPVKAVIIWFYEETDIRVDFHDTRGNGVFRMDLTNVSLRLLDEMENRKFYILDENKSKHNVEDLEFKFKYDADANQAKLAVKTTHLSYEDMDEKHVNAKLKIDIVAYDKDLNANKHKEVITIKIEKESLLKGSSSIPVTFPLKLSQGKWELDIMVTDLLGEAVHRSFVKVNVKSGDK